MSADSEHCYAFEPLVLAEGIPVDARTLVAREQWSSLIVSTRVLEDRVSLISRYDTAANGYVGRHSTATVDFGVWSELANGVSNRLLADGTVLTLVLDHLHELRDLLELLLDHDLTIDVPNELGDAVSGWEIRQPGP